MTSQLSSELRMPITKTWGNLKILENELILINEHETKTIVSIINFVQKDETRFGKHLQTIT